MSIKRKESDCPGVYLITNKQNGKRYVGGSKRMWRRFRTHINALNINDHDNVLIEQDYLIHGEDAFQFSVIEVCSQEVLIEREQYWLDVLNPEYNIARRSDSCLGVKRREETKSKMRGRPKSEETKRKLSEARMGMPSARKGVKLSEETLEKMRQANLGKKYSHEVNIKKGRGGEQHSFYGTGKAVIQFTKDDIFIKEFVSAEVAVKSLNKIHGGSNIRKCCDKKIPTAYGYKWEYAS